MHVQSATERLAYYNPLLREVSEGLINIHAVVYFMISTLDLTLSMRKWLQQYRAMITKRCLNFIRFHVGVLWQLLLPLVFVILGLALAVTIRSHHHSDPTRVLMLRNSAPSENLTLFHAAFVNTSTALFEVSQQAMIYSLSVSP